MIDDSTSNPTQPLSRGGIPHILPPSEFESTARRLAGSMICTLRARSRPLQPVRPSKDWGRCKTEENTDIYSPVSTSVVGIIMGLFIVSSYSRFCRAIPSFFLSGLRYTRSLLLPCHGTTCPFPFHHLVLILSSHPHPPTSSFLFSFLLL